MNITAKQEQCNTLAAAKIAGLLTQEVARKRRAVFVTAGGRSVAGVLRELQKEDIPWKHVEVYLADERCVPRDDPQSNHRQVTQLLPKAQVYEVTENNIKQLSDMFMNSAPAAATLLSAGEDGHVASVFPGMILADTPYALVEDAPKEPPKRITMTHRALQATQHVVLLFYGEGKKEALQRFEDAAATHEDCPAKIVLDIPHTICTDQR